MTAQIIDGKALALSIRSDIANTLQQWRDSGRSAPGLAVIIVGDDPASHIYVKHKAKACRDAGIYSEKHELPADTSQEALHELIHTLNNNDAIDGILLQLPLPAHLDSAPLLEAIHPDKDVDGFHPYNLGLLAARRPSLRPCTPYGIIKLLEHIDFTFQGADITIVGTSTIVGRPMALECLLRDATVTLCHRHTKNLADHVKRADCVIVAVGKPNLIPGDWIKEGAVVIDVGINRLASGELCGDVAFDDARRRASFITPVPGGVGPMTIAMLLSNTLFAAEKLHEK